ncbi:reverse transcriptase domain, Reverse transcriptase zinc-binding domain protein [Artemisia annua]|uniref:Reverse transcriptase domain, Reverse transcriptase zinc-binding domain protein n=1 Tax=Artemisia annua TaxID=35608 RepID=A0A2U1MRK8_ARTAN|nr:reverse transcriptase domain, Reverse transcriptase zinc-binding domain protein [Artemisia annua]
MDCLEKGSLTSNGGLGIGSLFASNIALVFKWWWRFYSTQDALWKDVICSIHGNNAGLNVDVDTIFIPEVGDGSLFSFREDHWLGNNNFKTSFPRLFALEVDKLCKIKDRCTVSSGLLNYNWAWRCLVRDGHEGNQLTDLLNLLQQVRFKDSTDKWICYLDHSKVFTVAAMTSLVEKSILWNLDLRGIDLDSTRCPVCDDAIETTHHLFIECEISRVLWNSLKIWWGMMAVPINMESLISWAYHSSLSITLKNCFDVVVQTTFSIIWRYRNSICINPNLQEKIP